MRLSEAVSMKSIHHYSLPGRGRWIGEAKTDEAQLWVSELQRENANYFKNTTIL
jgi:hypothetical protein